MDTAIELPVATCSKCGRTAKTKPKIGGELAVPKNWKALTEGLLCRDCLAAALVRRGAWFPVASAHADYTGESWSEEEHKSGWKALREALRISWRTAAQLYNWSSAEFLRTDTAALVQGKKGLVPGPWDRKAAVKQVRSRVEGRFPGINELLDSQAKYAIIAAAERAYFRTRFDRQVLCRTRTPEITSGRFPIPVPFHSVNRLWIANRQVYFRLRIAGQRFTIRLKGGHGFWRQINDLKKALENNGVGELKIQARGSEVMVGFSLLLPRDLSDRRDTVIRVETCKESLWRVFVGDREEPWNLHEDSIRQAIAAHRERLHRITDDLKMERRRPHQHSEAFARRREQISEHYRNRLADHCHKAAALLEGLAVRHKACRVEYNDSQPIFGGAYPAFKLRELCKEKLERRGIEFNHADISEENEVK